jgi:hypothetical protein
MFKKRLYLIVALFVWGLYSFGQSTIVPGKNGGTGIANTGKTITLGGSVITTGTSTPTLAFPSTSRVFTYPDTAGRLAMFHYTIPRSGTISGYPVTGQIKFGSNETSIINGTNSVMNFGYRSSFLEIGDDGSSKDYSVIETASVNGGSNNNNPLYVASTEASLASYLSTRTNVIGHSPDRLVLKHTDHVELNTPYTEYINPGIGSGTALWQNSGTGSGFAIGIADNSDIIGAANRQTALLFNNANSINLGYTGVLQSLDASYLGSFFTVGSKGIEAASNYTSFAGIQYDASSTAGYVTTNQTAYTLLHRAAGDARWLSSSYSVAPTSASAPLSLSSNTLSLLYSTGLTVSSNSLQTSPTQTHVTSVGTLTTGTWNASTIGATHGGTGISTYSIGDILYANTTSSLANLHDVATGNSLISGGIGVAPSWGKIGLTTHVSGTLPVANGGTGLTTFGGTNTILFTTAAGALSSNSQFQFDGTNVSWTGTTNAAHLIRAENTNSGGTAQCMFRLTNNSGDNLNIGHTSSNFTASARYPQRGTYMETNAPGGMVMSASNASGQFIFLVGGALSTNEQFRIANNGVYTSNSGYIGINTTPTTNQPITSIFSLNGTLSSQFQNTSGGTAAISDIQVQNSTGNALRMLKYGTGFTTSGLLVASLNRIFGSTGNMLFNLSSGDFIWAGGGTAASNENMRLTTSGLGVSGSASTKITAPTAYLHLAAGGIAAGSAPLKFTTQAAGLTSVEQGAMELIGNSLQFTQLAKRRGVAMTQSTRTSTTTLQNSTTESAALLTIEHGAGYLEVGKMEEGSIIGKIEQRNNGNAYITIRVKYAGSTILTFTTTNSDAIPTGTSFELKVTTTCRSTGASGTLQVNATMLVGGNEVASSGSILVNIDTTTAQDTTVTAQWAEANASDILTIDQGRVLCIEPNK